MFGLHPDPSDRLDSSDSLDSFHILNGLNGLDNLNGLDYLNGLNSLNSLAELDLGIGLTKASVRRSALLITTDSGPRHFAAAFGVPVLSLFGPTHIAWTRTYHPHAIHLRHPLPCGPCQKSVCPLGHHRCMRDLTPQVVYAAARRYLL